MTRLAIQRACRGGTVGWFAPTYKLLAEAYDEVARRLGPAGAMRRSERTISVGGSGKIEFWTLEDEDAGRSRAYDLALIDEAGLARNLFDQWVYSIRPTLADRRGEAWFAGTPKGRNGFYTLFTLGVDGSQNEWSAVRMPTSSNPCIAKDEIEAARRSMPDRAFRQEFLAEFVQDGGGVFEHVRDCVAHGCAGREPEGLVTIGIDLARLEDYTVLSAVDSAGRQVAFERFNRVPWAEQADRIYRFASAFGEPLLVVDATGVGDPVVEMLTAKGLRVRPYRFTAQTKQAAVERLSLLLSRQELSLLDEPVQINELESYEYQPLPGGGVRTSAPAGMHDDCVMALALAVAPVAPRQEWRIV